MVQTDSYSEWASNSGDKGNSQPSEHLVEVVGELDVLVQGMVIPLYRLFSSRGLGLRGDKGDIF